MKLSIKKIIGCGSVLSAMALAAMLPFNMGGCGSDISALGNSIGGTTGNLISSGGKAINAVALSEKDEDTLGQSVALQLTNSYTLDTDENLNKYLTYVGLTVADSSPAADRNWVFGILDTDEVNAFSGPNGYVFITRGLLKHVQNEAELAGVLGHEIGHVNAKDGLNAVKQAGLLDAGVQAAKTEQHVAQLGNISDNFVDVILKKGYAKDQEFHADAQSVHFVEAAGYDPNAYLAFLKRIEASHDDKGGQLMSTHPGIGERAVKVAAEIAKTGKGGTGQILAERFAANVK